MIEIVVALCVLMGFAHPSPAIVRAIAEAAQSRQEAAITVVYAVHESGLQERPAPISWDARAGVSCGFLQLRCALSSTPAADARTWLALVRSSGLAAVDSSPARAARRQAEADGLVRALP